MTTDPSSTPKEAVQRPQEACSVPVAELLAVAHETGVTRNHRRRLARQLRAITEALPSLYALAKDFRVIAEQLDRQGGRMDLQKDSMNGLGHRVRP